MSPLQKVNAALSAGALGKVAAALFGAPENRLRHPALLLIEATCAAVLLMCLAAAINALMGVGS